MTEREKAERGLLYRAGGDQELSDLWLLSKELINQFNQSSLCNKEEQKSILTRLLGGIGNDCLIVPPFYCDYGHNIRIGDHFFANTNLVILDCTKVTIGNHVYIGPNVGIYTAAHPFEVSLRRQNLEFARPIFIGDDVWIGGHVSILPGVNIGSRSVIGAGSVVTKDIPENVVAAGNPCKVIRKLSEQELKEA